MTRPKWNKNGDLILAPNGMNLSRSMNRRTSRASRLLRYLAMNGPSSKKTIAYDIFGVAIVAKTDGSFDHNRGMWVSRKDDHGRTYVTSGWGTYLWRLLIGHGYVAKRRVGRTVVYELTPRGHVAANQ